MIAVIFEVVPSAAGRESYFEIAADLKPLLETIDGFISVERFQSLADPENSCRCPSGAMNRRFWPGATRPITVPRRRRAGAACSSPTGCGSPPSSAITAWMSGTKRRRTAVSPMGEGRPRHAGK